MSPDAPEAEIFKEYARKHESHNGTATATIPAAATGTLIKATVSMALFEPHASLVPKNHMRIKSTWHWPHRIAFFSWYDLHHHPLASCCLQRHGH